MNILTDAIRKERFYQDVVSLLVTQSRMSTRLPACVTGLCEGARYAFFVSLIRDIKENFGAGPLMILSDEREVNKTRELLLTFGIKAKAFVYRDFMFHNITASHEYEHERLSVLSDILRNQYDVILATPDAALQYTVPREVLSGSFLTIKREDEVDLEETVSFLLSNGYVRTELVDAPGQFAVRGGILDVFAPMNDYPFRMELFGDEVDQIGIFDIMTQRKIEDCDYFTLSPARELRVGLEEREKIAEQLRKGMRKAKEQSVRDKIASELEAVLAGEEICFADRYYSLIYPQCETLLDYFPDDLPFILQELPAVRQRLEAYEFRLSQEIEQVLMEGTVSSADAKYSAWKEDLFDFVSTHTGVVTDTFLGGENNLRFSGLFNVITRQTVSYADNGALLLDDLAHYLDSGYRVLLLCENEIMAKNLRAILEENENITAEVSNDRILTNPQICFGTNFPGYELNASHFAIMSQYSSRIHSISTIRTGKRRANKRSAQERVMSYADLTVGDYVVHINHGIGQYLGLETVTVDGVTKDFVKIKYAGTDSLFLPASQLDRISKYIGPGTDDGTVKLSRMSGTEWVKTKARVKAATKEMAKELIRLYATRKRREGFAFARDGEMQKEFERNFEYEETDGQLQAISEIKRDMEGVMPMDRLLCGDVGFGKTEVAMRAAFKAVENGKQVAMLVPTTILAMQHYQTFLQRLHGFPVKVEMLSRFRTPKQQEKILHRLAKGDIDVIVGTHRILSQDLKFSSLGLLIIDEEQRFGVAAKEKLKQIGENIDVLTLTATPIPRTLNMAMSGIRDMSILEEAPNDRLPVQTYVMEYEDLIIQEAIRKELHRGGQVFYLYNRVESIDSCAARVLELVPEARIAIAHGQMDKEELSDIWNGMLSGDFDILICTTIIESGVDVPNANTLIIEDSDRLGLSQLHQIRGRVGRSSRKAYAYFTYPKGAVLSEISMKRLSAIREYTEFGSGFKVALRDLEIRGAGNLLGAEQHGHIDAIGYDLYMKLLNEAILEEKGEKPLEKPDCLMDLNVNAYIPDKYIHSHSQRIDAYRKIAMIETEADMRDVFDELLDRYGSMPAPTKALIRISYLHHLSVENGLSKVTAQNGSILMIPRELIISRWQTTFAKFSGKLALGFGKDAYISYKDRHDQDPYEFLIKVLTFYQTTEETK